MKKSANTKLPDDELSMEEILQFRTEVLAGKLHDDRYEGLVHSIFVFELSGEIFGIEAGYIQKVIALQEITDIPQTPKFIKGIFNYRGGIHTLIDPGSFFDLRAMDHESSQYILMLNIPGFEMGLLVDSYSKIRQIRDDDLIENIPVVSGKLSEYIKRITKDNIVVLDIEKFLACKELIIDEVNN